MSKRFGWWLGSAGLVSLALFVACGTTYKSTTDGLVLVGSQGSALLESFSFDLTNGHIAAVNNPPSSTGNSTCVLKGIPASMVLDTAGAYAYTIIRSSDQCSGSATGIQAFKVNSDGTLTAAGNLASDPNPIALAMDTSGKFLFVAEGLGLMVPPATTPTPCIAGSTQYLVCTYAIGSGGALTPVQNTYNLVPGTGFQPPNAVALAPTPTTIPTLVNGVQTAVCASPGNAAPTNEFLYAADSVNNVVWEFVVNMSTGALSSPPNVGYFQAGSTPSGVAVDPCDRFVYVSDLQSNQISGYRICSVVSNASGCPAADGRLVAISGSPFSQTLGLGPGPLLVDPFGKYVYVLETRSNQILPYTISPVSGSITAGTVAVTGNLPISMAIRGDDQWLFVTNFNTATLSQYSIIPATGALSELPAVQTDNQPWGVAVK